MQKRKRRKRRAFNNVSIIRITFLAVFLAMAISVVNELYKTIELNIQIEKANEEHAVLLDESNELENQIAKLQDKDYLQSFVSGRTFVTQEGSNVFILPNENAPE